MWTTVQEHLLDRRTCWIQNLHLWWPHLGLLTRKVTAANNNNNKKKVGDRLSEEQYPSLPRHTYLSRSPISLSWLLLKTNTSDSLSPSNLQQNWKIFVTWKGPILHVPLSQECLQNSPDAFLFRLLSLASWAQNNDVHHVDTATQPK